MNAVTNFYDVIIIGGGIHGAAIAADCAGRGLKALICHDGDFGGTASMIGQRPFHCGLQYLQRGDIARVNDSLHERCLLLERAPHLVSKSTFIIPKEAGLVSTLKNNTNAFLYNLVSGEANKLHTTTMKDCQYSSPLREQAANKKLAIYFDDLLVNDSQLSIEHLILAKQNGASILPQTQVKSAGRSNGLWSVTIEDTVSNCTQYIQAQCMVNTTGSAARHVQQDILGIASRSSANNYHGAYLVTSKLFEGDQSYLLENDQEQLVAALNYLDRYALIGPYIYSDQANNDGNGQHAPTHVIEKMMSLVNNYFKVSLTEEDIIHSFNIQAASYKESAAESPTPFSQDYVLDFNCADGKSPAITLFGTCINMHRIIAEQVIEQLNPYLKTSISQPWTKQTKLPGGEINNACMETFLLELKAEYPWLPHESLNRYARLYGSRTLELLRDSQQLSHLGKEVLPSLYEQEVRWLYDQEWALTPETIIWHRTKLGLQLSQQQVCEFNQWFNSQYPYRPPLADLQLHTEMNRQAS
ncbi:MAG: glycerol-3-phosphate dehydrogenase [Pseudomonadales bacterium]|nr:glycerol-3-phosphate dehydrogenase [Pseudomonadales bacterium]